MIKVMIDPGHGGRDSGARTADGRTEKETNLECALRLSGILAADRRFYVDQTRYLDIFMSHAERIDKAEKFRADVLVSLHADWSNSSSTRGHHAIHSVHDLPTGPGFRLARSIIEGLNAKTGRSPFTMRGYVPTSVGTWARWNSAGDDDFYGMIRRANMPSVIVERGFLSNSRDADLMFDDADLDRQAMGIANGITGGAVATMTTPILGKAQATRQQVQEWARSRAAHERFIDIANEYWRLGELLGIRPEVAYAQSAKETAFGRYGGAVHPDQNNWAGIKTATATGDRPEDHDTFESPEDGVRAHFNHLCAYVGKNPIGDPHGRYYLVTRFAWAGSIRYVEELGKRWAPNPDYGHSIVRDYLSGILATTAPEPPDVPEDPPHEVYVTQDDFDRLAARVGALESMIERVARALTK